MSRIKTYTVKEVAEMLNTNPETVRRWIRDNKLEATIESKKGGHKIYESALQAFLKTSPKYTIAAARSSLAGTALLSSLMIGGLVAQNLIDSKNRKDAHISNREVIKFLKEDVKKRADAIESKEKTIEQLKRQVELESSELQKISDLIKDLETRKENTPNE